MNLYLLFAMVLIGGIIGWTTNIVAIKMLFRPIKKVRILFWDFQGVLPRRQSEIADSIGETVAEELLSKDEILTNLLTEDARDKIKGHLTTMLTNKIQTIIPQMFLSMLGQNLYTTIQSFVNNEGDKILDETIQHLSKDQNTLNIKALVAEKINALDFSEFEDMVYRIMKKELKHIEQIGLLLGLLIGGIQYIVTLFL